MMESPAIPFELDSLDRAHGYQKWIRDGVEPYLGNRILEVGSGTGGMSRWLPVREKLLLTEKEPHLFSLLKENTVVLHGHNPKIHCAQLAFGPELVKLARAESVDTFVSFNVMEHFEDDESAFKEMFSVLRDSKTDSPKRLVTFVPAHGWAYGSMDKTFGHFRRYGHRQLAGAWRRLAPDFSIKHQYYNLPGLLAWLVLGKVLKKEKFGLSSVDNFERVLPVVRPLDDLAHKLLRIPLGQSLLMVATKN